MAGVGIAYKGAGATRLVGDWISHSSDPNDDWWQDGRTLAERAWDLYQNNPLATAMVETMVDGTIGDEGLRFRSLYCEDDDPETSPNELKVRRQINAYVDRATGGMRADAAGMLSWFDMHRQMRACRRITGEAFALRVWKPNRVNARTGTCWRLVDPARICNPNFGANTKLMFEGFELDEQGVPLAVHVISSHQNLIRYSERKTWTRVPIYADDGTRNVIHLRRPGRADQIRTTSDFSPILTDTKHLDDLKLAWVVGKKANASIALLVNTKDPRAAAAADKNGALLSGNVGIKPLMKYYMGTEDKVTTFGYQFQGAEFDELLLALMQVDTATWRLPVEMVLARLTRTNMAASRSALMLAFRTFRREQNEHIEQAYDPMIRALIVEGIARGEIKPKAGVDLDCVCAGKYLRPAMMWPDPLKEAHTAAVKIALGVSPSTALGELGHDYDDECGQKKQDDETADAQGVPRSVGSLSTSKGGDQSAPAPADDTGEPADGKPAQGDQYPPAKPAKEAA